MMQRAVSLASGDRASDLYSPRRAIAGMATFVTSWAIIETVALLALRRATPLQTVFARYTVHLGIVLALWGRQAPWRTRALRQQLARSAMMLIMPASFVVGVSRGVPANWMWTVFWCAPLLVLAFASLVENERATASTWAAAAIGWVAAWVYYAPEGRPSRSAIVFGLAMAASFAAYIPMTRRLRHEPLRTNLFYTAVVPWLALIPALPRVWQSPTRLDVLGFVFVGAAGWICLLAIDRAAEAAPVADTAGLLPAQVAVTMLIAVAQGQAHGFVKLATAAALLVLTLFLASIGSRRQLTSEPA